MTYIKKAVIPAAGFGTRFLPITKTMPKEMLPVLHKPTIQYVLEEAHLAGIEDVLIITGRTKRAVEDYFDSCDLHSNDEHMDRLEEIMTSMNIHYVRQRQQNGLGDAIRYARSFVGNDPFAVLLGDTITIPSCTGELCRIFERVHNTVIALEQVPKEKISRYGVIDGEVIENQLFHIKTLVEKPTPEQAPSDMAILGRYILMPSIFKYLESIKPGKGGEIQLTDALQCTAKNEMVFGYHFRGKRYDIGNKVDWFRANVLMAFDDPLFREEISDIFEKYQLNKPE